jgi:threonine/homoserine/homoserine lactone efflux protein
MILASGLNFGIPKSIPHWLGICTGVPLMLMVLGLGLERVFLWWPPSFIILKISGGLYLLYLALKIARTNVNNNESSHAAPFTYLQGALFQWINPKAWVMCLSAIPAFTLPEKPLLPQIVIIAVTFLCIGLFSVGSWLFAGSKLKAALQNELHHRIFNISMGTLLVLSIFPMLTV